ncbi:hypothetical protein H5410_020311 [Solanum commersonii]|uniref:Uncharacterized protein n=1 Tax=Solanum commersonii TaxID=4109 RepID=A0A9J5ZDT1_SOLCO|nr:hypothetical protein H5410_020311 [Solanum commersonii]
MTEAFKRLNAKVEALLQENAKLMEQVQSLKGKGTIQPIHTSTQTSEPSCPSHNKMDEQERMNTSARRDSSGNNNRSLSSGEDDYGNNAYYQDAQDPNDNDDSGMSFDSIALHNLDT